MQVAPNHTGGGQGKRTYVPLDAFRLSDGRVMVRRDEPGHRIPEEFVPLADVVAFLRSKAEGMHMVANVRAFQVAANMVEDHFGSFGEAGDV